MKLDFNLVLVFLVTLLALSCQGKKVPKVIKSLNKALGLPAKSKVVWDILEIEGIDNEVEDNSAKIEMYHPNTTSTSTTKAATVTATTTETTTTTTTTTSPPSLSPTLLLIIGPGSTEILDLSNDNVSCTGIPDLKISHATGDTVNGIPIVCSGIVGTATDSCYVYSKEGKDFSTSPVEKSLKEGGKWVKYIQTISNKVYYASSISLSNSLFVTGGYEPISKVNVNTTSLVFTNGTIKNGPNMPEGLRHHCMASMYGGTVAAIIGGNGNRPDGHHNGLSMSETYLYHETNQSYTEGPKLPIKSISGVICTAFTSKSHGYRPVVVYGAHGFTSLYLWDYTISNDWETFVDLPNLDPLISYDELLATSTEEALYFFDLSNPGSNTIYSLNCGQFFCSWDQIPQNRTTPGAIASLTMMFIPESLANCA